MCRVVQLFLITTTAAFSSLIYVLFHGVFHSSGTLSRVGLALTEQSSSSSRRSSWADAAADRRCHTVPNGGDCPSPSRPAPACLETDDVPHSRPIPGGAPQRRAVPRCQAPAGANRRHLAARAAPRRQQASLGVVCQWAASHGGRGGTDALGAVNGLGAAVQLRALLPANRRRWAIPSPAFVRRFLSPTDKIHSIDSGKQCDEPAPKLSPLSAPPPRGEPAAGRPTYAPPARQRQAEPSAARCRTASAGGSALRVSGSISPAGPLADRSKA